MQPVHDLRKKGRASQKSYSHDSHPSVFVLVSGGHLRVATWFSEELSSWFSYLGFCSHFWISGCHSLVAARFITSLRILSIGQQVFSELRHLLDWDIVSRLEDFFWGGGPRVWLMDDSENTLID